MTTLGSVKASEYLGADRPYKVQRLRMQDYSYIGVGKVCVRLENGKERDDD